MQYAILDSLEKALASAHIREQILRFVRLFALTFLGQLAVLQSQDHISRSFIVSAAVGAAEAVFRQIFPAVSTATAMPHIEGALQTQARDLLSTEPPAVQ